MDKLLNRLRAAAEETRLRLLVLLADNELTVSELVEILAQSQPRVSRHLKVLCDAGFLERIREGSWVFYRMVRSGEDAALAQTLLELIPPQDPQLQLDRSRLRQVGAKRDQQAGRYFAANAARWDQLRSLHVSEADVEAALIRSIGSVTGKRVLDIGTGTGRMLELFSGQALEAVGIDCSREMLEVARARLRRAGLANATARLADMYQIPFIADAFDVVTIHQVLHYADRPANVIREAGRVLAPGGHLVIVDFAPHHLEELRQDHAHRRLGFADEEIERWFNAAGLVPAEPVSLPGSPLTVRIWAGSKQASIARLVPGFSPDTGLHIVQHPRQHLKQHLKEQ